MRHIEERRVKLEEYVIELAKCDLASETPYFSEFLELPKE